MRRSEPDSQKPVSMRLFSEVNRLRQRDGKERIGFLTFAGQLAMFHAERNPQVAEALRNFDRSVK